MFMALGAGVGRRGPARGRRGDVPPVHPRLLQGPAVPRLGQRDARDGRRDRHAAVRRPAASAADTPAGRSPSAAWPWPAIFPLSGLLQQGRDPAGALKSRRTSAHELGWGWVYWLIYWVAIFTAFLTAFYTGRAFFMTFWGPEKLPSPDDPEAPRRRADAGRRPRRHDMHGHGRRRPCAHGHGRTSATSRRRS